MRPRKDLFICGDVAAKLTRDMDRRTHLRATAADQSEVKINLSAITRKLTITASDQYGLPTAPDDEILFGLPQFSRIQNFATPTVTFASYQVLKVLGWSINTNNYRRLKESINRWMGVTLYYENAWRDNETGQWIDASFHFLEQVEFYKPGQESAFAPDGSSVFKWNDLVSRNFREGNLKILDFHLYRALEGGITKRLFRFLAQLTQTRYCLVAIFRLGRHPSGQSSS